jgi:hypothetical protein
MGRRTKRSQTRETDVMFGIPRQGHAMARHYLYATLIAGAPLTKMLLGLAPHGGASDFFILMHLRSSGFFAAARRTMVSALNRLAP